MSRYSRASLFLSVASAVMCMAEAADAAVAGGGGGMPYSQGLSTLSNSVKTEIAGILILIAIVIGVGMWIAGGQLDGMLMTLCRVIIGACIIGSVATFLSAIGVTGAMLA
jgi:type IV secretory pathway VirB2 component (pilin)